MDSGAAVVVDVEAGAVEFAAAVVVGATAVDELQFTPPCGG